MKIKLFREYLPQVPWDRVEQMMRDIDIEIKREELLTNPPVDDGSGDTSGAGGDGEGMF